MSEPEQIRKSIAIEDYDSARGALVQALSLAKLIAANSHAVEDPECVGNALSVLEELLERVETHLKTAADT